ncbi:hypothetical protein KAH94_05670 [bacterium]|nr:hypothetical protein [bacterium]
MNRITGRHWLRFKQGLPSIIFMLAIQIWGSFRFPEVTNFETPWDTVWLAGKNIIGIACITYLFLAIDKFAWLFRLDHIEDSPYCSASTNKRLTLIGVTIPLVIFVLFMWSKNPHQMLNSRRVFSLANMILAIVLLYRASCRIDLKH